MPPRKPGLFEELQRRHVWRVAVAYAIVGWLVVQVATQVFPAFHMPDWTAQFVVIVVAIGFPIAVVLAWAFELTPEGIRRTESADSPAARAPQAQRSVGQKLNALIIGVLVLAVAVMGWRLLALRHAPAGGSAQAVASAPAHAAASPAASAPEMPPAAAIPAKSIAVLPFENLSNDKDNDYFVAGMQDLILTKLADIGSLKVISRTSTMQYGSHPENLKTVGQQLGVAKILEGSVQKAGNQVLINVQLIDTPTDSHVWAESYTRTLDNIFGVEGDVAEKIATALNTRLSGTETASLAAVPTKNRAAYDFFLRAEYQANKGTTNYDTASWKGAIPLYRQAVEQDPNFALAWARLSFNESQLAWFGGGGEDVEQLNRQARADAERALQLQPDLAAAQLAIGYNEYWGRGDFTVALQAFGTALKLKPNDADAFAAQAFVERRQGRFDTAITSFQRALALDPRNSALAFELGLTDMDTSRYADAANAFQRALALDPDNLNAKVTYSNAILFSTGDVPRALAVVQGDAPALRLQHAALLVTQRQYRDALALLDGVPDTPDNFGTGNGGLKPMQQANVHWLMGDTAQARLLYANALPLLRAQLKVQQGINLAFVWQQIGNVQIGLGQAAAGLDAIAQSQAIIARIHDQIYGPAMMMGGAQTYAQARRPDLAVPLLAKALVAPGVGFSYSPVMLWLDPVWDPVRHDPGFQALLKQYAKYKPAVTYDNPHATAAPST